MCKAKQRELRAPVSTTVVVLAPNFVFRKKIGERAKMVEHYEKKRLELEKKSIEEEKYMKIREEAQMRLWELGVQSIAEEESENMAPGEKEPSSRG